MRQVLSDAEQRILDAIDYPITRNELALRLDITVQSVCSIVSILLKSKLIKEDGGKHDKTTKRFTKLLVKTKRQIEHENTYDEGYYSEADYLRDSVLERKTPGIRFY